MTGTRIANSLLMVVVLFIFIQIVYQFQDAVIGIWDESLYANNSIEMHRNGDLLTYFCRGETDHHNSKPPLVIWLQALSYFLFGYTEAAVRFPTFLALAILAGATVFFSKRIFRSYTPGILAAFIILTSKGLIRRHVFLTGDLDGVLVLFTTLLMLYGFYLAWKRPDRYTSGAYALFFTLFTLGWLTKSTAVLLVLPSAFLPFLWYGNFRRFVFSKKFALAAGASLLILFLYYLSRELITPGYIRIVWESEVVRVYRNVQPWLQYERSVYFDDLRLFYYREYFYATLILLTATLLLPGAKWKREILLLCSMAVVYLVIITIPDSKMSWYAAPAYPVLALLLAVLCSSFYQAVVSRSGARAGVTAGILLGLTAAGMFLQSRSIIRHVALEKSTSNEPELEIFALKQFEDGLPAGTRVVLMPQEVEYIHHLDVLQFYLLAYELSGRLRLQIGSPLQAGDTVIVSNREVAGKLQENHPYLLLDSCAYGRLIVIR